MYRPVLMGFKANFHVKNSTRQKKKKKKSPRPARADQCEWQACIFYKASAPVSGWKCTNVWQTARPGLSAVMVLLSCAPGGDDIKTKGSSVECCQNGKYNPLYVSYSNYTNCIKKESFFFFYFLSPFHQMCVKCHYALILVASKSVEPFIIKSYLNSFSSRPFFFFFVHVPSLAETEESVKE